MFIYSFHLVRVFFKDAANGTAWRSWDIWSYVRPADGAENEVNAFCFTFHDPTDGQPEEPKMSSEIGAMLAIVRPNCAQVVVSRRFIRTQCCDVYNNIVGRSQSLRNLHILLFLLFYF